MKKGYIALISMGHLITDINQGAIPVLLPFLIAKLNLSYAYAAGIVFALNISSSLVQPLFGYLADRFSKSWLIPLGVFISGAGIAFIGVAPDYWSVFFVTALSGIGIAAFHPEAARLTNIIAGDKKATAMSIFGIGGQLGFAIGPILTTFFLFLWDLQGTLFFLIPVTIMALLFFYTRHQLPVYQKTGDKKSKTTKGGGKDKWWPFVRLTAAISFRSITFYGLNTFLPLYLINALKQSKTTGGVALTILLASGVTGTLIGGKLGDKIGYKRTILLSLITLTFMLPTIIFVQSIWAFLLLLVPLGISLSGSFSPSIVMGQRYLPNRVGFASGVTLGLAITVGGITAPILGKIGDIYGITYTIVSLTVLPLCAFLIALTLPSRSKGY
ncbi:MAG: MFS transporter [Syntrophorhabdaceae bacterium]|nr:MFS transporter [Syntrophorhabdaceae bacterium]